MSADWLEAFFYLYERTGNLRLSAERCGRSRNAVYKRIRTDKRFADRVAAVRGRRSERLLARVQ